MRTCKAEGWKLGNSELNLLFRTWWKRMWFSWLGSWGCMEENRGVWSWCLCVLEVYLKIICGVHHYAVLWCKTKCPSSFVEDFSGIEKSVTFGAERFWLALQEWPWSWLSLGRPCPEAQQVGSCLPPWCCPQAVCAGCGWSLGWAVPQELFRWRCPGDCWGHVILRGNRCL